MFSLAYHANPQPNPIQVCAMDAVRPVLQNSWSASTLLAGINHMDQECLKAIKHELPDDPAELAKLSQVR